MAPVLVLASRDFEAVFRQLLRGGTAEAQQGVLKVWLVAELGVPDKDAQGMAAFLTKQGKCPTFQDLLDPSVTPESVIARIPGIKTATLRKLEKFRSARTEEELRGAVRIPLQGVENTATSGPRAPSSSRQSLNLEQHGTEI